MKVWSGEEVILQQCTKIMIKKVSLFLKVLHCSGTLLSSLPSLISDTQIPINFSCPWDIRYTTRGFFTTRGFPEAALLLDPDKRGPSSGHCALEELVPHLQSEVSNWPRRFSCPPSYLLDEIVNLLCFMAIWSLCQLREGVYSELDCEVRSVLTCVPEAPSMWIGIWVGVKARDGAEARAGAQLSPGY